jgi:hypothetical protein
VISTASSITRQKLQQAASSRPSPREIRQRMARIRQSWSPGERALRARHHQLRLRRLAVSLMAAALAPLTAGE